MDVGSLNSYSSSVNGLRNLGLRVLIWNMGRKQYHVPGDSGVDRPSAWKVPQQRTGESPAATFVKGICTVISASEMSLSRV